MQVSLLSPSGLLCVNLQLLGSLRCLDRTDKPFIKPELPFEKSGQYKDGTTFLEGLVLFNNIWYLYYGTADSMVGVVTAKQ